MMQHGYARGTGEKLTEFLTAQMCGKTLLRGYIALTCGRDETIYLYAWESIVNLH